MRNTKVGNAIEQLTRQVAELKAREAKLRDAVEQALTFHQTTHIHAVLRAALVEGEDTRG